MTEEIPLIPPVPPGLRDAAQRGTLIPFVGAGATRLAGCPGWPDFADGALRQLVAHGKLSHGQLDLWHIKRRVKMGAMPLPTASEASNMRKRVWGKAKPSIW